MTWVIVGINIDNEMDYILVKKRNITMIIFRSPSEKAIYWVQDYNYILKIGCIFAKSFSFYFTTKNFCTRLSTIETYVRTLYHCRAHNNHQPKSNWRSYYCLEVLKYKLFSFIASYYTVPEWYCCIYPHGTKKYVFSNIQHHLISSSQNFANKTSFVSSTIA